MAVSPAVIKAGIALATDKRTWTFVGSVICGVILMTVGIVAAFLNIFSYDDKNYRYSKKGRHRQGDSL